MSRLSRHRSFAVVLGLVVAGLAVLVVVGGGEPTPDQLLEPGNPAPDGALALRRVLDDHGVRVTVAHGQDELAAAEVDDDTTVFVTSTDQLSAHTSRRLRALGADAGALVLAGASPATIQALGLGVQAAAAWPDAPVSASCDDPLLSGLELDVPPTTTYVPDRDSGAIGVETCFPAGAESSSGLVARVTGRPSTYLVGAVELFTNGQITGADDAAVALRLLGQQDRLVWYVADGTDVPPGDAGSLRAMLPPWLGLAVALLGVALLTGMVWRGRRLGPLVVEPLPVVVKAVESTASRGRLYGQARDRDHASAVLREATATRLAEHLRLPAGTSLHQLVPMVAAHANREPRDVRALLEPGPVPDDRTLTLLAQELTELEREVRQS